MQYITAFYQLDRVYGGPQEGGWYFDTGTRIKYGKAFQSEPQADKYARRVNSKLSGCIEMLVYPDTAPKYFPKERPHYDERPRKALNIDRNSNRAMVADMSNIKLTAAIIKRDAMKVAMHVAGRASYEDRTHVKNKIFWNAMIDLKDAQEEVDKII